jgi:hypothetical protein
MSAPFALAKKKRAELIRPFKPTGALACRRGGTAPASLPPEFSGLRTKSVQYCSLPLHSELVSTPFIRRVGPPPSGGAGLATPRTETSPGAFHANELTERVCRLAGRATPRHRRRPCRQRRRRSGITPGRRRVPAGARCSLGRGADFRTRHSLLLPVHGSRRAPAELLRAARGRTLVRDGRAVRRCAYLFLAGLITLPFDYYRDLFERACGGPVASIPGRNG